MIALMVFGCALYLFASEYVKEEKPRGEVLLFRRREQRMLHQKIDEESHHGSTSSSSSNVTNTLEQDNAIGIQRQTAVVHWDNLSYTIKIKKEERKLLDDVEGFVKPETMTALMVRNLSYEMKGMMADPKTPGCYWRWQDHTS